MKSKPISIRNIADELNTSITSVSFILNGKAEEKHISEELAKKVLDYAKHVNYKPNLIAQSLRTGKSKILVFMVEDISDNFFSKLARTFEDLIYDKGYKVIFCSNDNNDEKSNELIDLFTNRQVDGFIIVPSPGIRITVENLIKQNIPVILLDRFFEDLDCNIVGVNNKKSVFDAINHLVSNKFKSIGFVGTNCAQNQMVDRLSGYQSAISKFGLKPKILLVATNEISEVKDEIKQFIEENEDLDAIFFANNFLAQNGLKVFKEDNYKLGKNIGIVAFDDNDIFTLYPRTITCVSQPIQEMGHKLVQLMLFLLNSNTENKATQKIILKSELIIRESSFNKKIF